MKKFPLVESFLLILGRAIGSLADGGSAYAQFSGQKGRSPTVPKVAAAGAAHVPPAIAKSAPAQPAKTADSARAAPPLLSKGQLILGKMTNL